MGTNPLFATSSLSAHHHSVLQYTLLLCSPPLFFPEFFKVCILFFGIHCTFKPTLSWSERKNWKTEIREVREWGEGVLSLRLSLFRFFPFLSLHENKKLKSKQLGDRTFESSIEEPIGSDPLHAWNEWNVGFQKECQAAGGAVRGVWTIGVIYTYLPGIPSAAPTQEWVGKCSKLLYRMDKNSVFALIDSTHNCLRRTFQIIAI